MRLKPKTVLFVSFSGKSFNDSPKVIYDAMCNDPKFDDYTFIWAFKDPENYSVDKRTKTIKIDTLKYLIIALGAEYWITNVNIERGLHFKKSYTKYVNTWHGIPIKKIGNHVKGRNDFNFYTVDLFVYSGDYELKVYQESFKLTRRNLRKIGLPRNDELINSTEAVKNSVRKELKIPEGKKIILFAPTWRDDSNDIVLMNFDKWKTRLGKDYILLVKMHGLNKVVDISNNDFVMDVSYYENTARLLQVVDVLITDYSSILFDYGLLKRPVLIYATDFDKYNKERGVYFDLRDTNLIICESDDALLKEVESLDYEKQSQVVCDFIKQFVEVTDGNATESILTEIFGGK